MRILVCTDGSEQSKKALEKALLFSDESICEEVAIIHVDDEKLDFSSMPMLNLSITEENREMLEKMQAEREQENKRILQEAAEAFAEKGLRVRTIAKEGHPSRTIARVAAEENFDMIIIGNRGLSGLGKVLLGSTSNAVAQEVSGCSILIVK